MMRWVPNDATTIRDDAGSVDDEAVTPATDRMTADSEVRYLLDAVAATVAGLGARSVALTVALALIVATLLLGLSAGEAEAIARWCPQC